MNVFMALVIIAILVLAHEWGHFIVARKIGIPVYEFSIGFGYKIFSRKKDGVEYSLRLIPLGGFVRMAGEEQGDMDNPDGFNKRTPWEKMSVAFAGPFMNFVLAIIIFIGTFALIGIPQPVNEAIIGDVIAGKPAEISGLRADDRIVAINNEQVVTWQEFVNKVHQAEPGNTLQVNFERDGISQQTSIEVIKNVSTGDSIIGVYSKVAYEKQNIVNAIKLGFTQTVQMTVLLLDSIAMLFTGAVSTNELAGPIGITSMIGEAAQGGFMYLLSFTAFLSINLGLLNLLPIPALDGSRIFFALVEAVRGKAMNAEREGFIHWLGFMFLLALIFMATYNDIIRLIKG